jgi:hypothetical protein
MNNNENPEYEKATHGVWFPCLEPMPKELSDQLGYSGGYKPSKPFDVIVIGEPIKK